MIIDGQFIHAIKIHKRILVEKIIKDLSGPNAVPIFQNFDYGEIIGIADILWGESKRKTIINANIYLFKNISGFPAIGYTDDDDGRSIYCLSINSWPNVDPDIKFLL